MANGELEILLAERRRRQELQTLVAERDRRQQVLQQAQSQAPVGVNPIPVASLSASQATGLTPTGVPLEVAQNVGLAPGFQPGGLDAAGEVGQFVRDLQGETLQSPPDSGQPQSSGIMGLLSNIPVAALQGRTIGENVGLLRQAAGLVRQRTQQGDPIARGLNLGPEVVRNVAGEPGITTGGEAVMRAVGGRLGGPLGAAVLAPIGAGGALVASKLMRGQEVKSGEIALEMGFTALPDALVKPVGAAIRKISSLTAAGREAGEDVAGQFIRERSAAAFNPPNKEVVGDLFENVRQSGALLEPKQFAKDFKKLGKKEFKFVLNTIEDIRPPPGKAGEGFGEGITKVFDAIRKGEDASGLDLGVLQHISSGLKKAAASIRKAGSVDLIRKVTETIDNKIESGLFIRGGEQSELLLNARAQWKTFKEAEEFQNFVFSRAVTRSAGGGTRLTFNFDKMVDAIKNPVTRSDELVVKALDNNPGAKKEVLEFMENMKSFKIGGRSLTGEGRLPIESASKALGLILPNAAARARFNQIVRQNGGVITEEILAVVANSVRRGAIGTGVDPTGGAITQLGEAASAQVQQLQGVQDIRQFLQNSRR